MQYEEYSLSPEKGNHDIFQNGRRLFDMSRPVQCSMFIQHVATYIYLDVY